MKKIIFIIGGIRSGKTQFAIKIIKKLSTTQNSVTYIATGTVTDKEMKQRIEIHKKLRPKTWKTVEEQIDLKKALQEVKTKAVIIDCINFWVRNLLKRKYSSEKIISTAEDLLKSINRKALLAVLISNEVGLGPVAPYKSGRIFQDILGKINQVIAKYVDEVYFLVAGLPIKLK